jgi:hypothetical protein
VLLSDSIKHQFGWAKHSKLSLLRQLGKQLLLLTLRSYRFSIYRLRYANHHSKVSISLPPTLVR